jgi:hypothetical protein
MVVNIPIWEWLMMSVTLLMLPVSVMSHLVRLHTGTLPTASLLVSMLIFQPLPL